VTSEQLTLEYWLAQLGGQYDLDQVLLSPQQIATLNASLQVPRDDYHPPLDLSLPLDPSKLAGEVEQRRVWAREKLASGEYVSASGAALPRDALEILGEEVPLGDGVLRVVLKDVQIHCAPMPTGFYSPALDLRLDRNACSTLRAQDLVKVIAEWPNGMRLVQAEYSFGWLPADVQLSPALPERWVQAFARGPAVQVVGGELTAGEGSAGLTIAAGTRLPAADRRLQRAHVATASGFVTSSLKQAALLRPTARGLTRRALFEEAWRYIGTPYGLGDTNGGRDCSRLLLDSFESFGLRLPRHSSWQSKAGSFWIDVETLPEPERLPLLDAAAQKGIVLLHFPGHIMLYLGRNELGTPMVLHALGEYAEPCPGQSGAGVPAETLVRVKNATVSDLELGRGTSRTALLSRLTRITVIGGTPGVELAGVAQLRPAAESPIPSAGRCSDSEKAAIYVFPEQPNQQQPLRIVSSMSADPGPARLTLIDPDGRRITPELVRLGGPPFGQVATVQSPRTGKWKAIVSDGDTVLACQQLVVRSRRPKAPEPDAGPIWKPKYKWHVGNENLYALFVERLFDYPMAEERVWSSLHSLLRDADRNILFDYRGLDEDSQIELVPDCADLPYALRAYFAWKMRLPFGYRRCTRGRAGRPPSCDEPGAGDNLMSRLELPGKGGPLLPRDDVQAFGLFVNTYLASAVHSSSGRTAPEEELSDLYPVALTREALKPGTVFADPYGHLLVLADWIPQGLNGTGMLVGVDAQPDGSIGQRRFWRGSFLFNPETTGGGAGFKVFRPRLFVEQPVQVEVGSDGKALSPPLAPDAPAFTAPEAAAAAPAAPATAEPEAAGAVVPGEPALGAQPLRVERVGILEEVENEDLRRSRRYPQLSLQQYQGSSDDFYDTLERLINPRPLEPKVMLRSLIDALGEAATRRVSSVDNAEKWFGAHPDEVVEMPEGDRIFLSVGAWEDFSTPSRDLRLLIAIDTVLGFAASVRAAPERFGLRPEQSSQKSVELSQVLASELLEHTLSYTRSDGSQQRLTLKDVVERARGLEVAYNPNDCSEIRWAAPPGSSERETCQRHAPPEQRARMDSYRAWFSTRNRPPQ
jgi:hypothetical protein